MADTLRTFVALTLPPLTLTALGEVQEGLKRHRFAIRWVRPENIHLTLKFLGDIPSTRVASVADALAEAVSEAGFLNLGVRGVGVFPGIKRPRIVWAGLCGDTPGVIRLHQAVETGMAGMGFARETRGFKAHLTLGRVKGHVAPERLAEALRSFSSFSSERFIADAVTFLKSDLQPSGAVYTTLKRIALCG